MTSRIASLALSFLVSATFVGCERTAQMPGPTVNKFTGKLVAGGNPVTFKNGEKVSLSLTHSSAQSFGIPIKEDGSFSIGEMPIGKYTAVLLVEPSSEGGKGNSGQPKRVGVPEGFEIVEGKTEYTVDLGDKYKP